MSLRSYADPIGAARERQQRIVALIESEPGREWSVAQIHERLWRYMGRSLVESALVALRRAERVRTVFSGAGGGRAPNRYAAVEQKGAANG